jgi:predicted transcriptional regulator
MMGDNEFPECLRLFIFQHFESVEQIEVLLLLKANSDQWNTPDQISKELRTNRSSVIKRLENLMAQGFIKQDQTSADNYQFCPKSNELAELTELLSTQYRIKRHTILEILFSPAKNAKTFADAFIMGKSAQKKKESDG